jgi:hypothetical protein
MSVGCTRIGVPLQSWCSQVDGRIIFMLIFFKENGKGDNILVLSGSG